MSVERTRGGHRVYRKSHIDAFSKIKRMLKEEHLSIKEAYDKIRLEVSGDLEESVTDSQKTSAYDSQNELKQMMALLLEKMTELCSNAKRRDELLVEVLNKRDRREHSDLLVQLQRSRFEAGEAVKLCDLLLKKHYGSWKTND